MDVYLGTFLLVIQRPLKLSLAVLPGQHHPVVRPVSGQFTADVIPGSRGIADSTLLGA